MFCLPIVYTYIFYQWFQYVLECVCAVGKAVEINKQRSPKQLPQSAAFSAPDQPDPPALNPGSRTRVNLLSEGSDTSAQVLPSPTHSSPVGLASDTSGQDSDSSKISLFVIIRENNFSHERTETFHDD